MNRSLEKSFGHYKIISKLGAGGMGEVFLAEDTRLERKVALKILPEKFTVDAEPLNRFKQEAKAASALNHPNIITVYEIGEYEKTNFIAAEFIDGKTLRERLEDGGLTFDETLSIVVQTAEALAAAHAAGIVHRDIKPENIMIRPDGYVKVLDFGLAKLTEKNNADADAEDATRKLFKTNPGAIMGTVSYMSPEQARGKEVDARSDVFSFGVVLYEVLAGKVPFAGETMTDILAAIITTEPAPLQSVAPHLPRELHRIVGKTLKKKREQRYNSTKDLLGDLKDLRDEVLLESKLEQSVMPNKPEIVQTSASRVSTSSGGGSKDALLLTEFENSTGEAIFDQTLKTALAFSLAQSPFLDVLPEAKVRQTLELTGRSANERVTKDLAYEICLRQNLKAFVTGMISSFGTTYVLTLEAINSRTGESLGQQFQQASSREEVLTALGQAATDLREKLGESLGSIEKYDIPFGYATTPSLEALKLFLLAHEQQIIGKRLESIQLYKKALEFDPKFASAYSALGAIYANANQRKLAEEMTVKAFALREKTSEFEKLTITYFYYSRVTGEIDKAIDTVDLWRKTYPSQIAAVTNLSDCFERIGESEKAVAAARESLRLGANRAVVYMNLAESLLSLDRYGEVKEVCEQAFEKKFDGDSFHISLYIVAFIEMNTKAMSEHTAWFRARADEHIALNLQTGAAAFCGEWRKARDSTRHAIDLAKRSDAPEVAALYAAEQALRIVFWSSGGGLPPLGDTQLRAILKTQTNNALRLERSNTTLWLAALALACAGQSAEAKSFVDELKKERPKDTLINELWLPTIRAALELQNGMAKEAIEELEIAERFEKAGEFYPQYIRALSFLKLNKMKQAIAEFDKILNHRGEAALSSIYPLAQLGKARATRSKAEYEKFFELWTDADKDMPALVEAKKEFENLSE